jgi:hypothetical protein
MERLYKMGVHFSEINELEIPCVAVPSGQKLLLPVTLSGLFYSLVPSNPNPINNQGVNQ